MEFIAEIGINHDGDFIKALDLVDAAKESGADTVKIQSFVVDELKGERYTSELIEILKRHELSFDDQLEIWEYAESAGLQFLSSPFDLKSLYFLYKKGMRRFKIASSNVTNIPLLNGVSKLGGDVIISTGMSSLDELSHALDILSINIPLDNISILHCVSEYPTPIKNANLRNLYRLSREFPCCPIGFSDHSGYIIAPILATEYLPNLAMIESHITLDQKSPGPDHIASIEPAQFAKMVQTIKDIRGK